MKIFQIICIIGLIIHEEILPTNQSSRKTKKYFQRRSIDGSRGRKYYKPNEDDSFNIYDSLNGKTEYSDLRNNIPGEPGVDYPSYTIIPQTSFICQNDFKGYYADEEAGCQLFHVCDSNFLVSSFLCPIGSIFSQRLLTCDWWSKVNCSLTKQFYSVNNVREISQVDDDEILHKAYEMTSLQSTRNHISISNNPSSSNINSNTFDYYDDDDDNNNYQTGKYISTTVNPVNYNRESLNLDYYHRRLESNDKIHSLVNDGFINYKSSYAPTVPTVTTTTRKYYSPTIPPFSFQSTTSKPNYADYDLDIDTSNHLYLARGKNSTNLIKKIIQKPLTTSTKPLTITTKTIFTVTPSILIDEFIDEPKNFTKNHQKVSNDHKNNNEKKIATIISAQKSNLIAEYHMYDLPSDNLNLKPVTKYSARKKINSFIPIPSSFLLPPFLYFSNNYNNTNKKTSEHKTMKYKEKNKKNDLINVDKNQSHVDTPFLISLNDPIESESSSSFQVTSVPNINDQFNYPTDDVIESVTHKQNQNNNNNNNNNFDTTTYKPKVINYTTILQNKLNQNDKNDLIPRPFSNHQGIQVITLSNINRNQFTKNLTNKFSLFRDTVTKFQANDNVFNNPLANESSDEKEFNNQNNFGRRNPIQRQIIPEYFDSETTTEAIITTTPATASPEIKDDLINNSKNLESNEKTSVVHQTEFIPSISFSLDSNEGRQKFLDALFSGLFTDGLIPQISKQTETDDNSDKSNKTTTT